MFEFKDEPTVAVVGSPSSNDQIRVVIRGHASHEPLVGQMVFIEVPVSTQAGDTAEFAMGVLTHVEQRNGFYENPVMQDAIKNRGDLGTMSGDHADSRQGIIRIQAVYRKDPASGAWLQSGSTLGTAPPTGTPVSLVTDAILTRVVTSSDRAAGSVHYLGHLYGSIRRGTPVPAPMSIPLFTGQEGSWHGVVCGQSGSGKSVQAAYMIAGQMRDSSLGVVIVDPQSQFAREVGLSFSLQSWAQELGRDVQVARISEDLCLRPSPSLFTTLLGKADFLSRLRRMNGETESLLLDEIEQIIDSTDKWAERSSADLLTEVLTKLIAEVSEQDRLTRRSDSIYERLHRVYSDAIRQDRLRDAVTDILEGKGASKHMHAIFAAIHNLFQKTNPDGRTRDSLNKITWKFLSRDSSTPAPLLILDMSSHNPLSALGVDAPGLTDEQVMARNLLDQDNIKAAILREVCRALKESSDRAFQGNQGLNTMVVIDEAWRFAPPPQQASDPEIKGLSEDLGAAARDWRKYGIGLTFITQTPRSLNPAVWDQCSVRMIGYGLAGAELDRVAELMDDREDGMRLYRSFSSPKASQPAIYPFLLMGPVSPLSFSKAPVAIGAYTDFDDFRRHNADWIAAARAAQGLPVLTGTPLPGSATGVGTSRATLATRGRAGRAKAQAERVREHRSSGGIDPAAGAYLSTDPGFSDALDAIHDGQVERAVGPHGRPIDPDSGEEFPF